VAQFGALRCLGAGDCGLAGLEALAPLAPLAATLQAAAFEGCPLAALPHYRAHARPLSPRAQLLQAQRARREAWRRAQLSAGYARPGCNYQACKSMRNVVLVYQGDPRCQTEPCWPHNDSLMGAGVA
jgi:hypothetical protein